MYYGWIPTPNIKDGVVRRHSSGSTGALLSWVPRTSPPIWEVKRGGEKIAGKGRGLGEKQCSHHQPLRLQFSLLCMFLHVHQHPLQQTKIYPPDQVQKPKRYSSSHKTIKWCWNLWSKRTFLYLLGAVACTEKLFTVCPAAFERLEFGAGVVVDQVLLQVLRHPEHQRTAVPLSTQDTFNQWERGSLQIQEAQGAFKSYLRGGKSPSRVTAYTDKR